MSWLALLVRGLGRVLGIVQTTREIVDEVEDLTGTLPSRQLSPEDIRRQQAQMRSATAFKVPPKR